MSLLYRERYSREGSELKMDMKVHLPGGHLGTYIFCQLYIFSLKDDN